MEFDGLIYEFENPITFSPEFKKLSELLSMELGADFIEYLTDEGKFEKK